MPARVAVARQLRRQDGIELDRVESGRSLFAEVTAFELEHQHVALDDARRSKHDAIALRQLAGNEIASRSRCAEMLEHVRFRRPENGDDSGRVVGGFIDVDG